MTGKDKNELLFDGLLSAAVSEAFRKEMERLPSNEELNRAHLPSPELDGRINKLIVQTSRKAKMRLFSKSLGRTAACLAIVFILLTTVALSVEATRNAILNAVIDWREKYASIQFQEREVEDTEQSGLYYPGYLPEGFEETSREGFGRITTIIFSSEAGEEILFDQEQAGADTSTSFIDNENTIYKEVKICDSTGYLFEGKTPDDSSVLIWQDKGMVFQLTSRIKSTELIQIAESLKTY